VPCYLGHAGPIFEGMTPHIDATTPESKDDWKLVMALARRVAEGDASAVAELDSLTATGSLSTDASELADTVALLLARLEGRKFLMEVVDEVEERLAGLTRLDRSQLKIAGRDLRDPIGAIRGLAMLMSIRKVPEEQQHEFMEKIVRVSDQLLALVDGLGDGAAGEAD
jgi:signal transduction histidine kinase